MGIKISSIIHQTDAIWAITAPLLYLCLLLSFFSFFFSFFFYTMQKLPEPNTIALKLQRYSRFLLAKDVKAPTNAVFKTATPAGDYNVWAFRQATCVVVSSLAGIV